MAGRQGCTEGTRMRTTVSDTRASIDGVSMGTTAAFHPPGSDCVVKMLLSTACVLPAW